MRYLMLKLLLTAVFFGGASLAQAAELTVSAAASLTNAFRDIASAYEARNPGSKVMLNFGASGALLQQIAKGAPVDVFATADQETMELAATQGLVKASDRRTFTRNTLVVVVPADSKPVLKGLPDLAQNVVTKVAMGSPGSVPAGRYAKQALQEARLLQQVEAKAVYTQNVRQALDYVARGEVDAGFVYASDATLIPDKVKVAFRVQQKDPILYPIAPTAASEKKADAGRFIDFVMSPAGQAILAKYGFLKP